MQFGWRAKRNGGFDTPERVNTIPLSGVKFRVFVSGVFGAY